MTLNTFAHRRTTPEAATVIYSMDIVFSVIFGAIMPSGIIDTQPVTPIIIAGCALIVLSNVITVLPIGLFKETSANQKTAQHADSAVITATKSKLSSAVRQVHFREAGEKLTDVTVKIQNHWKVMNKRISRYPTLRFVMLLLVFLLVSLPFKVMEIIPGFTDIRPIYALAPIYGAFFGPIGCLVFGVGNFIADIVGRDLHITSILGFIANCLIPFCTWFFWNRIYRKPFSLRTISHIGFQTAVNVFTGLLSALIITPGVAFLFPHVDWQLFALSVVLNCSVFSTLVGIPLIFLVQDELNWQPTCALAEQTIPR
jgi:energy-coupling factor transport system substrate-specific component